MKADFRLLVFCLIVPLFGCSVQPTIHPTMKSTTTPNLVTITGLFTTIWNGGPHYSITDDQGQTTQLLLDDETAKPLGGPLELDRKRVTVQGVMVDDPPGALQVLSVSMGGGE